MYKKYTGYSITKVLFKLEHLAGDRDGFYYITYVLYTSARKEKYFKTVRYAVLSKNKLDTNKENSCVDINCIVVTQKKSKKNIHE